MEEAMKPSHAVTELESAPASSREFTPPENSPPSPNDENRKRVQEMALRQLHRFISYEAKVLKGDDADAIHDMRVASRRLQQVLDLLYPDPQPQMVRRSRKQIRRCRQLLGDVRNCDVMLEIVNRSLARKRSARREAWTAVQHFLIMRRSEAFLVAVRKVGKLNLSILYVNLKELLEHDNAHHPSADASHPPGDDAARPKFANDLNQALESVWNHFADQIAHSHRDSHPEIIHGARIATKRLRYLLEVFHELGAPGSADALICLRQLQKDLGDWHDLVVLEQMTIEMLAHTKFLRDHLPLAMQVEKLILRNRENRVGLEEKYFHLSGESIEMQRLKEWISGRLATLPRTAD